MLKSVTRIQRRSDVLTAVIARRCFSAVSANLGSVEEIEAANERYKGRIEIQKNRFGHGVFAQTSFEKGAVVFTGHLVAIANVQHSHTIQTSPTEHVIMDLPARFSNHKCGTTNIGIKVPENNHYRNGGTGVYDFVAKQNIDATEELLWDYETTEFNIDNFACSCGSEKCRHSLQGFRRHYESVLDDHGTEWVAPYLLGALSFPNKESS